MVFVGYATAHGSTRSVAERVERQLRGHGFSVDVGVLSADTHLPEGSAVVIGSAIHNRDWLPEAHAFVAEHRSDLLDRSVWLFSVGMPAALPRPLRRLGRFEGSAITRRVGLGRAVHGTAVFSGVVSATSFPKRLSRLMFKLMGCRYGDFRDWAQIDSWADTIALRLAR